MPASGGVPPFLLVSFYKIAWRAHPRAPISIIRDGIHELYPVLSGHSGAKCRVRGFWELYSTPASTLASRNSAHLFRTLREKMKRTRPRDTGREKYSMNAADLGCAGPQHRTRAAQYHYLSNQWGCQLAPNSNLD